MTRARTAHQQRIDVATPCKPRFILCGCCEHLHPADFAGDCRDDTNRFLPQALDRQFGDDGLQADEVRP